MSARLPPGVAWLARAGAAPGRLITALAGAEELTAAFQVDLDRHALCREPDWQALIPADPQPSALSAILARLSAAQAHADPLQVRGGGVDDSPGSVPRARAAVWPPVASDRAGMVAPGGSTAAPATAAIPSEPAAGTVRPMAPASPAPPARPPAGAAATPPQPGLAPPAADPILRAAAARSIRPMLPGEPARVVRDLLDGAPVAGSSPTAAAPADPVDPRLARVLDRLAAVRPASSPPASLADAPASAGRSAAPIPPAAPPPTPAPRNGLERLLVRAGREGLPPSPPADGARPIDLVPAPARVAADLPDPLAAHRRPAALAPADPGAVGNSTAELPRMLTDLLRREARAAGIDIGRDR